MYITFYILVQTHLTLVHLLIIINPILFQKANIILPGKKIENGVYTWLPLYTLTVFQIIR